MNRYIKEINLMDSETRMLFDLLEESDKETQYKAFVLLLEAMEEKVNWTYEVWDDLVEDLSSIDNHKRARAGQFLSYLAISDPEKRIVKDFSKVWKVTYDERFVTARHTLQASWRIGLAGEEQKELLLNHYKRRFKEAENEKNDTMIRSDITKNLKQLYEVLQDVKIKEMSLKLIDKEQDLKYRKKYEKVWR